jgi:hypothetical protein
LGLILAVSGPIRGHRGLLRNSAARSTRGWTRHVMRWPAPHEFVPLRGNRRLRLLLSDWMVLR